MEIKSPKGIMTREEVVARAAKCEEKNLCFISSHPLGEKFGILNHGVAGPVRVLPQYADKIDKKDNK